MNHCPIPTTWWNIDDPYIRWNDINYQFFNIISFFVQIINFVIFFVFVVQRWKYWQFFLGIKWNMIDILVQQTKNQKWTLRKIVDNWTFTKSKFIGFISQIQNWNHFFFWLKNQFCFWSFLFLIFFNFFLFLIYLFFNFICFFFFLLESFVKYFVVNGNK